MKPISDSEEIGLNLFDIFLLQTLRRKYGRKKRNSFIITEVRDSTTPLQQLELVHEKQLTVQTGPETTFIPNPAIFIHNEANSVKRYCSKASLLQNPTDEQEINFGSKDSLISERPCFSIRTRRNVKSLPMLNCSGQVVGGQGSAVTVSPRPERKSEPVYNKTIHTEIMVNNNQPSETNNNSNLQVKSNKNMLINLNKDLDSIFHTATGAPPGVNVVGTSSTKTRTPTTPRPVSRRSVLEDTPEFTVPSRPVSRRSNLGFEGNNDESQFSRPPSQRSYYEELIELPPQQPPPVVVTKTQRPPGKGMFKSLSRTSIYEDPNVDDLSRSYYEEPVELPSQPPPTVMATRTQRPPGKGMFKSLSRASIYEDPNMDDVNVYHTISGGGRIAASRAPIPFAKITRRPTRLVAGIPSMVDEDFDTESIISTGPGEDVWRVSAILG